jgi:hypothetical protein
MGKAEEVPAPPNTFILRAFKREDGTLELEEIAVVAIRTEANGCQIPITKSGRVPDFFQMQFAIEQPNGVILNRHGQWPDREAYLRAWERQQ